MLVVVRVQLIGITPAARRKPPLAIDAVHPHPQVYWEVSLNEVERMGI
jgi:hypothetical protein